jgi:hypothetical protein
MTSLGDVPVTHGSVHSITWLNKMFIPLVIFLRYGKGRQPISAGCVLYMRVYKLDDPARFPVFSSSFLSYGEKTGM